MDRPRRLYRREHPCAFLREPVPLEPSAAPRFDKFLIDEALHLPGDRGPGDTKEVCELQP
ncbi:MAG: hypothetical protein AB7S61_04110 [Methanoregulaceae archaeon]